MASISSRKNGDGSTSWHVRWRENGVHRSAAAVSKPAAKKLAAVIALHGTLPDEPLPEDVPTFGEWAEHCIAHLTAVSDRTRDDYRRLVARHMKQLHDVPLPAITRDVVRRWVLDTAAKRDPATGKTMSGKTLKNVMVPLQIALSEAVDEGHLPANPARGVRLPRATDHQRGEPQFLTQDEFWAIAGELDEHWRTIFVLLASTGMRVGELMALTVGDVDLEAVPAVVRVTKAMRYTAGRGFEVGPTKTERSRRTISLAPMVVELLRPMVTRPAAAPLVVQPNGRTMYPTNLYARIWRPAVVRAQKNGMAKNPRIHDLRHSHASWLIAQGTPLPVIQNRLGHEQITTTVDRYGHLLPDVHVEAAAAAQRALER